MKWDSRSDIPEDTIPLWVADMDFKVAQPIQDALQKRLDQGVFGYTYVPDDFYQATINWFKRWHGWEICKELIIYTSGVVPAISAIIKAFTRPGDGVLIMTPVYNCFFSSICNNDCHAIENKLVYEKDTYKIDFEDLERCAAQPDCKLLLLCNPHNPAGRVWTKTELEMVRDIMQRHDVLVISDEIHCELVFPQYRYVPYATIGAEKWVSCVSPSKAFNIAGLQIANIVASNEELYAKIDRAINDNEVCDVNPFGVVALIAAYNHGHEWLMALIDYIQHNYELLCEMFSSEAPQFGVTKLEGTYLAWVDCRHLGIPTETLEEMLLKDAHVWVNAGSMYGVDGEGFIRINLATQRHRLRMALKRLIPVLNSYEKQ